MATAFGFGTFERNDREVKLSTLFMRREFLNVLFEEKDGWARDLLRIVNFDLLPKDEDSEDSKNIVFIYCLLTILGKRESNPKAEDVYDTPFFRYLEYLKTRESEISELSKKIDVDNRNNNFSLSAIRQMAINELIPDWQFLTKDINAEKLCNIIRDWGTEYNLSDEWLLDFALLTLKEFENEIFQYYDGKNLEELAQEPISRYLYIYNDFIETSYRSASSDFYLYFIAPEFLESANYENELPIFDYWRSELLLEPVIYYPFSFREEFIRKTKQEIMFRIDDLKMISNYGLNINALKKQILDHCNNIRTYIKDGVRDYLPSYEFKIEHIRLFSETWYPAKCSEDEFVKEVCNKILSTFEDWKTASQNIEKFSESDFDLKLALYCDKVDRKMPPNYSKTPKKYTDSTHFRWLAKYHVKPCKSYNEMVNEYKGIYSKDQIRKGIKDIYKKIGLTEREHKPAGRPKGSIKRQ